MSSSLDSAKSAVKSFLSKDGKHDTSVHTSVSPAVTNETVNEHRHDNVIKATDKEVHQDHYHTTVQPVHDKKTLNEQHHYESAPVEHRKFEHGNDADVKERLQSEAAQFKNTTTKGESTHTTSAGTHLTGEHVHHHVHENIQPVVQRQTVEPHVVHTTVPIHETHHSAAQHHSATALPAVSMDEFKNQGGTLGGREKTSDFFEGEPRAAHGHTPHTGPSSSEFRNTGHVDQHGHSSTGTTGTTGGLTGSHHGTSSTTGTTGTTGGLTGSHHGTSSTTGTTGTTGGLTGSHNQTGVTGAHRDGTTGSSGLTGDHHHGTGSSTHTGTDGRIGHDSTTHSSSGTTATKPSLLDRLNPMKDTDHDGKKGFMD